MKQWLVLCVIAVASLALGIQSASADSMRRTEPGLQATSIGVGAASTIGFFALQGWTLDGRHRSGALGSGGAAVVTTAGCLALSPIVGTVLIQRQLTHREAYGLFADCVVPFIGAWLVNQAFDAHPEWEPGRAVVRSERSGRHRPSRIRQ